MTVVWSSVLRPAARLPDHALRVPRRRAGADAGLPAADHAALRRRGGHAAPVRPQRHGEPAARRMVRFQDRRHGGAERRHLPAGHPLLPLHPGQSLGGAAQHRPRHGGGGAEPGLARPPPVPPHRPAARHARLRRRRQPGVRKSVRRRGEPAAAQRQGDAGAAGLSAHHLDRHRRSDGLRHLRRADRHRRGHHVGLGAGAEGQGLRHRCSAAAAAWRGAA